MPSDRLVRVEGAERLRALARTVRQYEDGRELRKQLRVALKRSAERVQRAEQAAVQALPSQGENARRGRPSLRRSIARATQVRVRTAGARAGVMVWVNPRRMPPGQHNLPAYMEGLRPFHRWRHPVYGNPDVWVSQRPRQWFYRTAARFETAAQRDAARAIDAIARDIERRG